MHTVHNKLNTDIVNIYLYNVYCILFTVYSHLYTLHWDLFTVICAMKVTLSLPAECTLNLHMTIWVTPHLSPWLTADPAHCNNIKE